MLGFDTALPLRLSANLEVDKRVQKDGGSSPSRRTIKRPVSNETGLFLPPKYLNQPDRAHELRADQKRQHTLRRRVIVHKGVVVSISLPRGSIERRDGVFCIQSLQ